MAGSAMTFEYHDTGTVKKVVIDWISDDVTLSVTGETVKISGFLLKAVTDPDGVAAPAANYDISLTDEEGGNILACCEDDLADRHTANTEVVDFMILGTGCAERPCVDDKITVLVENCGAGNNAGRTVNGCHQRHDQVVVISECLVGDASDGLFLQRQVYPKIHELPLGARGNVQQGIDDLFHRLG